MNIFQYCDNVQTQPLQRMPVTYRNNVSRCTSPLCGLCLATISEDGVYSYSQPCMQIFNTSELYSTNRRENSPLCQKIPRNSCQKKLEMFVQDLQQGKSQQGKFNNLHDPERSLKQTTPNCLTKSRRPLCTTNLNSENSHDYSNQTCTSELLVINAKVSDKDMSVDIQCEPAGHPQGSCSSSPKELSTQPSMSCPTIGVTQYIPMDSYYRAHQLGNERPYTSIETIGTRETFENKSFCSTDTASTSYSGAVIGVDLDLTQHHQFTPHYSFSTSSSSVEWFSPQMAEVERHIRFSEDFNVTETIAAHHHSMCSPALSSLLPIAEASGIVCSSSAQAKRSSHTQNGNLNQLDFDTSMPESKSRYHYLCKKVISCHEKGDRCVRHGLGIYAPVSAAIPYTTLPVRCATSTIQLPTHLKSNHRLRDASHTSNAVSSKNLLRTTALDNCGGFVKVEDFTSSRTIQLNSEDSILATHQRIARSLTSLPRVLKKNCVKARRRHNDDVNGIERDHAFRTLRNYLGATKDAVEPSRVVYGKREKIERGVFVSHTIRACFCQPKDETDGEKRERHHEGIGVVSASSARPDLGEKEELLRTKLVADTRRPQI